MQINCSLLAAAIVVIRYTSQTVSVTTFSHSKKCFKNVETQLLYPFLNALHKISRAIFFDHNALTESSLF